MPALVQYNTTVAKGHGVMVTRGSPKPLLWVRILLPLPNKERSALAGRFLFFIQGEVGFEWGGSE